MCLLTLLLVHHRKLPQISVAVVRFRLAGEVADGYTATHAHPLPGT